MSFDLRRDLARGAVLAAPRILLLAALLAAPLAGCGPSDPVAAVRELQAAGRFAESLEPLRELADARPDDAEVHYLRGLALLRTGEPSLALWSFRKAMEDREWLVPAALQVAANALLTGNHDAAVEAAGRILEVEPDHIEALVLRAQARTTTRRDYEGALADADRALALDPDNVEALIPRSVALLGLERVEEAAVALEQLEQRFREADLGVENTPRYCAARAIFAAEKGEPETADQRFRDCLEEFPASFLVVDSAIDFYDERREADRPIEILRAALEAAPFAIGYRSALAARLRAAGEVADAEQVLRAGTQLESPEAATLAWAALGDHYVEIEDYAAAAGALEQALAIAPEPSQELLFAYADALVMAGRYARALEVAGELSVPTLRDLVYGRAHLAQGQPAEALKWFTSGLRLSPNNSVARYYTARAAEGIGDFDRAISEYRYSIRADSDATDARLRLAQLHEAEGAYELALAAARHRTALEPASFDLDTELVALRVSARIGRVGETRNALTRLASQPEAWSRAIAAVAEGIRARQGPDAAAQWIRETPQLDLTQPRNAEVLRVLAADLAAAGDADAARAQVAAGLAAHPEAAAFHEILGLVLERSGAPSEAARAAYERAVELDPDDVRALAGLGRLAADPAAALAYCDRAAAADPEAAEPKREAAERLIALGRRDEAEQRLGELLEHHPYDAEAAARLAALRLEREAAETDRTLELARRAVRFGGGADAYALLARVHERRGEAELASEAAARAEEIRAGAGDRRPGPAS